MHVGEKPVCWRKTFTNIHLLNFMMLVKIMLVKYYVGEKRSAHSKLYVCWLIMLVKILMYVGEKYLE